VLKQTNRQAKDTRAYSPGDAVTIEAAIQWTPHISCLYQKMLYTSYIPGFVAILLQFSDYS